MVRTCQDCDLSDECRWAAYNHACRQWRPQRRYGLQRGLLSVAILYLVLAGAFYVILYLINS